MDKAEFGKETAGYLNHYIQFGDAKAATLLTLASAAGGGLASFSPSIATYFETCTSCGLKILLGIILVVLLISLVGCGWNCLKAISPQTTPANGSLRSFADIVKLTADDYRKQAIDLSQPEQIAEQYANHNWVLSHIVQRKFRAIGMAVLSFKVYAFSCLALLLFKSILIH